MIPSPNRTPSGGANDAPAWNRHGPVLWHRAEVWIAILAFSAIALLRIYDVLAHEALTPLLAAFGFENLRPVI